MAKKEKNILWEIGCDGHTDAWVTAENWELATVEAARFWGVRWGSVAAKCELKQRIVGHPNNVCCRCKRIYYGKLPFCDVCEKEAELEEEEMKKRLRKAYQMGKAV